MNDCAAISEMIPEYINNSTNAKQNAEIALHMSVCPSCRADFALWLAVARSMRQSEENAPPVNFQALLKQIPKNETELERIINSGSYSVAFDVIHYAFSIIKSSYRLAGSDIRRIITCQKM